MTATTKDFGPIRSDYQFFVDHSTEHAQDLDAYQQELSTFVQNRPSLTMLDFGSGDGQFTEMFLRELIIPPTALDLSLIEPESRYREAAVARLAPALHNRVQAWPILPPSFDRRFDLILSNHVLYYVPDLSVSVSALLDALMPGGIFITAMAGRENALIQFWIACFAMLGRPVPYFLADDLAALLEQQGRAWESHPVCYELQFPDGEERRSAILRFLLGGHFAELPRQAALDLFEPYVDGAQIIMHVEHRHFIVRQSARV